MAIDFKLPDLGENIESGDIVNVLVSEGDQIQVDQSVFEIETGKAVVDLPCPYAGKVTKVHVQKGSKVKVGDPLLSIESKASEAKDKPKAKAPDAKQEKALPAAAPGPEPGSDAAAEQALEAEPELEDRVEQKLERAETKKSKPAGRNGPATPEKKGSAARRKTPPAGPATRRLARELGVDLATIKGSGPNGRITEEDVKAAVRTGASAASSNRITQIARAMPLPEGTDDRDNWGPIRRQKMSPTRKAIAQGMVKSLATAAQLTNFDDADITELERIRKGGLTDYVDSNVKLTMMSFVMKAVAQSLRLHPALNSTVDLESEEIIYKEYVHIGVAVDTERGLMVPVIRDVDQMSIPRIAAALQTVAERARTGQLSLDEMRGSTFTISNMGSIGGTYSTPVINLPNTAILLLGKSRKLPIVLDGDRIEPRLMMPLSLTYDHRVIDGATAARFTNEVINYLSVPGRLLLAP